jgi:hypothetical protein
MAGGHLNARSEAPHGPLLASFHATRSALIDAHRTIGASAASRVDLTPAEEWLLDNFHLVAVQLREIAEDLPIGYLRQLPVLPDGKQAGLPRVYALALDFVAQTDARLDSETLRRYIEAYEDVAPLAIGELWAVPIMLRLCLLENLNKLAQDELVARNERREADRWADRLAARARQRPADAVIAVAELAESKQALTDGFVARLVRRLRDEAAPMGAAFGWLEERMTEHGDSSEEAIRRERYRQTVSQVSVGNSISSLRTIGSLDWVAFFEALSLVERELRNDPTGVYPHMDAPTRDAYRRRVEMLARRGRMSEPDVARSACALAAGSTGERERHVGYYLVDAGAATLEREVGYRPVFGERLVTRIRANPLPIYLVVVSAVIGLLEAGALTIAGSAGADWLALLGIAALALLPASEVAVSLANLVATFAFEPRPLPKLALAEGIPPEMQTAVVVPTIIGSQAAVQRLIEEIEVRFLANLEPNVMYGLLTDLPDAPCAEMPTDAALVEAARAGIDALNARYGDDRFFLVHRRRRFNPAQDLAGSRDRGTWMGWERKRGKLEQFVELIGGGSPAGVDLLVGESGALRSVRYVVTLDTDTQAPRDSVRRMVGTIAHPLNQPRLDAAASRVDAGYGLIQPRVSTTLTSAGRSLFARILTGNTGLDPYTTAVSDVYQDLFGEGSYFGKGIFDVVAFRATLADRIPENRFLSHDLFEGIVARTALGSDIELLDDFPSHYLVYASRQHRWIRGDWQWLPWLMPRVPAPPAEPSGLEAVRQPATQPIPARDRGLAGVRMAAAAGPEPSVDRSGALDGRFPHLRPCRERAVPCRRRRVDKLLARVLGGLAGEPPAVAARRGAARRPDAHCPRRGRTHTLAAVRDATEPARVGDRRGGGAARAARGIGRRAVLCADVAERPRRADCARSSCRSAAELAASRWTGRIALDGRTSRRGLAEPANAPAHARRVGRGPPAIPPSRAQDLAVLRDVRDGSG